MSNNEGVAEELLLRVAWFYYKDELTQDEIAKRLSVSRASVGRMLDRARKVGLVSINLNADHLDAFEVSRQLRQTFGLSEALVVPDHAAGEGERPALNARLGLGGAQFMSTHLRPGGTLGVGWGDTVSRVIAATNFGAVGPVRMVSLTGGVDAYLPAFLSSKGEGPGEGPADQRDRHPHPYRRLHPGAGGGAQGRAVDSAGAQAGLRGGAGHRRRRYPHRRRHHRRWAICSRDVRERDLARGRRHPGPARRLARWRSPDPPHPAGIGIEPSGRRYSKVVGVAWACTRSRPSSRAARG